MTIEERWNKLLLESIRDGVIVEYKTEKWYWRAIGKLLSIISFGKIDFMGQFHTTLANRIGVSPAWDAKSNGDKYATLLHEMKHIEQYKRYGFGNVWVGFVLVGIAYLLLPLPIGLAWCRAAIEKEGYEASMRAWVQIYDRAFAERQKDRVVAHFTGVNYMFMWPFKKHMNAWYDATLARVCKEEGV